MLDNDALAPLCLIQRHSASLEYTMFPIGTSVALFQSANAKHPILNNLHYDQFKIRHLLVNGLKYKQCKLWQIKSEHNTIIVKEESVSPRPIIYKYNSIMTSLAQNIARGMYIVLRNTRTVHVQCIHRHPYVHCSTIVDLRKQTHGSMYDKQ